MNTVKFWLVFSVGVAAGASVALLYAPQAGQKSRKQLRGKLNDAGTLVQDQYENASGYIKDQTSELGKQASATYEKTKNAAANYGGDLVDNLQSAVKSVKG